MFEMVRYCFRTTKEFCWDVSRMDAERDNTLVAIFCANELREAKLCQFACLVRAHAWQGEMGSDTADVDDLLVAAFEHQGEESTSDEIRSTDVDGPGSPPIIRISIHNLCWSRKDSCVVDYDVDLSEFFVDDGSSIVDAFLRSDVELDRKYFWGRALGCCSHLLDLLDQRGHVSSSTESDERCSGFGKGKTHGTAYPSGRSGDENALTRQVGCQGINGRIGIIVNWVSQVVAYSNVQWHNTEVCRQGVTPGPLSGLGS